MFVTKWADLVKRRSASIDLISPTQHGQASYYAGNSFRNHQIIRVEMFGL